MLSTGAEQIESGIMMNSPGDESLFTEVTRLRDELVN